MNVYSHKVNPEMYPEFEERIAKAVTRDILKNKIQFTSVRFFSIDTKANVICSVNEDIDLYTNELKLGNVFWLNLNLFFTENYKELVDEMNKRGLYLFDLWGFVPGTKPTNELPWGEFIIPEEVNNYITDNLKDRFFGYDNGEQDGRYIGAYASHYFPIANNRKKQYIKFHSFFEKLCNSIFNNTTTLSSLTFSHYFAKEGNTVLIGAETAQGLLNSQVWYSFIRGASKQYGILRFGNASVWNRWGYKTYESSGKESDYEYGVDCGTSVSLLRRLMYNHIMYNCDIVGFEQGWLYGDNTEKRLAHIPVIMEQNRETCKLTPIGITQQYANKFANIHYDDFGVLYIPCGIVIDFFSGWVPPRHLYTSGIYKVWGSLPYQSGDYQLHALFSMLFPGYENSGFYRNESGFLTSTPYGECVDILFNDARTEVLKQHNVLFILNNNELSLEFYEKLKKYVKEGGNAVIFASTIDEYMKEIEKYDSAYLEFFGLECLSCKSVHANSLAYYKGNEYTLKDFCVYCSVLNENVEIIAYSEETPIIIRNKVKNGSITVILSDDALEKSDDEVSFLNNENENVFMPYDYSDLIKEFIADTLNQYSIVKPTNDKLQYCVGIKNEKEVMLMISNNTHVSQCFDIISEMSIHEIEEIVIHDNVDKMAGFYPPNLLINNDLKAGNGKYIINAADIKFFKVKYIDSSVDLMPLSVPERKLPNFYMNISEIGLSIKNFIIQTPTFKEYFSGVMIGADYFLAIDSEAAKKEAKYLNRQNIKVIVDLTSIINHYPDLAFSDKFPERYEIAKETINSILEKMTVFRESKVIITVNRGEEGKPSVDDLIKSLKNIFAFITENSKKYGIDVYMQNRSIVFNESIEYDIANDIAGLKKAYNTCYGICRGSDFFELDKTYKQNALILSAPILDEIGQFYNSPERISGSEFENYLLSIIKTTNIKQFDFVALGANYKNWNEAYMDILSVMSERNDQS